MRKTILHHLLDRKEKHGNDIALQYKDNGRWMKYRWHDYFSICESTAGALLSLDVQKGDRVAIISETRPEWILTDMAILGIGGVTVPIYPNNTEEDVEFILNNSETKVLVLEDAEQYEKWLRISKKCSSVQNVVVLNPKQIRNNENVLSWSELLQRGRNLVKENAQVFVDEIKKLSRLDNATILYTSGTTGRPKGVLLTHEQIMSEMEDVFSVVTVTPDDMSLTFLPYSHIFGRVEAWGNIYSGYVLAFAESIDKIRSNLIEIQPTFLIAVPRIFEKIYASILAQAENSKTKAKIFKFALEIGRRVSEARQQAQPLGIALTLQLEVAKKLVFDRVMDGLGGRIRFGVSGGAPLSPDIAKFFHGIGLLICEGYGLTETTAAVTFNTPLHYQFGTVGRPLPDVKIHFDTDGEILVQSKKVMREYYNNNAATAEVMVDGYFRTGDIGHLDEQGFLHITDRKKDLIKTAGGKYVAPQRLENFIRRSPYISNVLIHGDQKKYIVSLVTLNAKMVEDFAVREGIHFSSYAALTQNQKVYNLVKDIIAEANTELASFESIKKFSILPSDFTVETGELTPSLKVKRRFCDKKFEKEINELYE